MLSQYLRRIRVSWVLHRPKVLLYVPFACGNKYKAELLCQKKRGRVFVDIKRAATNSPLKMGMNIVQLLEAFSFNFSHIIRDLLKLMAINFKKCIFSKYDNLLAICMIEVTIFDFDLIQLGKLALTSIFLAGLSKQTKHMFG
jgi:hypothetical protein